MRRATSAHRRAGLLARSVSLRTVVLAAAVSACIFAVPNASADGTGSDPATSPSCYLPSGCGGTGTAPSVGSGQTVPPNSGYGAVAFAVPLFGTGLGEIPLEPLVWGLGSVALGGAAFGVGWEIGSAIDHTWLDGLITDTGTFSVCGTWRWVEVSGDPFGIGHSNYSYLHAMCGPNNSDTFAASPHSSGVTDMAGYEFWHDVINYSGLTHGTLYAVSSTYCNGSSPCYMRADALSDILPLTGPYATEPPGMGLTVTSGWADPSTGKGVTSQAWPYGSGPSTPAGECKQAGVLLPCSSVSPTGGPVQPAYGWPSGWPTNSGGTLADGLGNPDINDIRCVISASFACPQPGVDPTTNDWGSSGGPKITMPDCTGISIADCEADVNAALATAGSSAEAGFDTTIAPTYDPNVPIGAVVATVPAANTQQSDVSSVELEENEEEQPAQFCSAHSDIYHPSQHNAGNMLAVFYLKYCNFTSSPNVLLSAEAWNCTSKPEENLELITTGSWGCVQDGPPVSDYSVTANGARSGSPGYLNGPAYDPSKWYVAYVWSNYDSPVVGPAWSEVTGPNTWP